MKNKSIGFMICFTCILPFGGITLADEINFVAGPAEKWTAPKSMACNLSRAAVNDIIIFKSYLI